MSGTDCRGRDWPKVYAQVTDGTGAIESFEVEACSARPLRFLAIDDAPGEPPPPPLPTYSDGAVAGFIAGLAVASVSWIAALCLGWML